MEKENTPTLQQIGEALRQFGKSAVATPPALESHWYIVVVGNIDFRQHTPLWYKLIGAIDEEEFKTSESTFLINPPPTMMGFRFDVGAFSLLCTPDRWEIATKHKENRPRMIDVASLVFQKLWEISTIAYGINSQLNLPTNAADVQKILAARMQFAELGFPDFKDTLDCQYILKNNAGANGATIINVMGSPLKRSDVILSYVQEYPVPPQSGYYDIGEMIRPKAEPGWRDADEFGANLVKKINGFAEGKNAD